MDAHQILEIMLKKKLFLILNEYMRIYPISNKIDRKKYK